MYKFSLKKQLCHRVSGSVRDWKPDMIVSLISSKCMLGYASTPCDPVGDYSKESKWMTLNGCLKTSLQAVCVTVLLPNSHSVLFHSPASASLSSHSHSSSQQNSPVNAAAPHHLQSAQHILTSSMLAPLLGSSLTPDFPVRSLGLISWFLLGFLLTTSPCLGPSKADSLLSLKAPPIDHR